MARFDDRQTELLHEIWRYSYTPSSVLPFPVSALNKIVSEDKISAITKMALEELCERDLLEYYDGKYGLTVHGISFIEIGLEDPQSDVSGVINNQTSFADPSLALPAVPASDRLIYLDHNSDPYGGAIRALDAAVTAFRGDRCLENDWGPEKGVLLESIEAGQRLLKETQVRAATIFAIIITPLRIILDRYRDAFTAGLITAGIDQIIPTLEKAIHSVLVLIGRS